MLEKRKREKAAGLIVGAGSEARRASPKRERRSSILPPTQAPFSHTANGGSCYERMAIERLDTGLAFEAFHMCMRCLWLAVSDLGPRPLPLPLPLPVDPFPTIGLHSRTGLQCYLLRFRALCMIQLDHVQTVIGYLDASRGVKMEKIGHLPSCSKVLTSPQKSSGVPRMMCPYRGAWIERRRVGNTRNVLPNNIVHHELLYSSVHSVVIMILINYQDLCTVSHTRYRLTHSVQAHCYMWPRASHRSNTHVQAHVYSFQAMGTAPGPRPR